jgi:uncharacterized membrane protein
MKRSVKNILIALLVFLIFALAIYSRSDLSLSPKERGYRSLEQVEEKIRDRQEPIYFEFNQELEVSEKSINGLEKLSNYLDLGRNEKINAEEIYKEASRK